MTQAGVDPVILQGDARCLDLPDESVDLIVTSPPYFSLRDYGVDGQIGTEATPQEYVAALVGCTREMVRVLKPSGSIFVNLGDKYAQNTERSRSGLGGKLDGGKPLRDASDTVTSARRENGVRTKSLMLLPERYRIAAVDELGLIARAVIVWSKPNGLPESVKDRVRRSHEDWVHLTKSPKYYAAVDEIRVAYATRYQNRVEEYGERHGEGTARVYAPGDRRDAANASGILGLFTGLNPLGKLPGSVWEIATQPLRAPAELGIDHFAAFPMEWPRRLILGWCPPGGVVLDPFGGTGTTALVAAVLGRRGISVDLSADYCRLAAWRVNDPKQRERAAPKRRPRASRRQVVPVDDRPEVVPLLHDEDRSGAEARDERGGALVDVIAPFLDRVEEGANLLVGFSAGAVGTVEAHEKTVARTTRTTQGEAS